MAKHIQIALVGGQPTPVYQGIIHMEPDQVILICSKSTKKIAFDIRSQLPSYSDDQIFIFEMSDTDLSKMYETAENIVGILPKRKKVSLNITSGMKLWSVIFNTTFRRFRRSCHTFFIGQNGTFFDLKEKITKGHVKFDMDTQFKILGHTLDDYTSLSCYTENDEKVLKELLDWELQPDNYKKFQNLTLKFTDNYKYLYGNTDYTVSYKILLEDNSLDWNVEKNELTICISGKNHVFQSEHVKSIVLNTGWFEYYTALALAQIYPKDQIRLNSIFKNVKNIPKNEIDIIVNTGAKLIFVECKTQVFNTTDVDKFNSAVKNYGGLGSKALFITNATIKPVAKEKCNDYNIKTFNFDGLNIEFEKEIIDNLESVISELNNTWNVK